MFKFEQLESIKLEITPRCQARCPMCSRNLVGGIKKADLELTEWSFEDFKHICNEEVLFQIKSFLFTGSFGDPILHKNFIDICNYIKSSNPKIKINVNTNGGIHKEEWWINLAKAMPDNHVVTFALDGLEDTHHLYRIGTTYERVIRNAKAFISAGGKANWQFIRFKHNEHQVEEAQKRARELGFVEFTLRETDRFIGKERWPVYDKDGNITHYLENPSDKIMYEIDKNLILSDFHNYIKTTTVNCLAVQLKEVFIDAWKRVYPCDFLGVLPGLKQFQESEMNKADIFDFNELMNKYNDLSVMSLKEIINGGKWQSIDWHNTYWNGDNKLPICALTCGKIGPEFYSKTNRKIIETIPLKDTVNV